MQERTVYTAGARPSVLETNKVLRNTYMLLSMTLLFSAVCAGVAMMMNLPRMAGIVMSLAAFGVLFVIHKKADKASGIGWIFLFTGLLGGALAPMLNAYVAAGMGGLIFQALGATALVFFALSGYVLTTKKDFSFMGGFLMVGLVVVLVAALANIFFAIPAVSLAISSAIVFIMSGLILFDTSRIIHGGETNYIRATVSLYLNIYNLFTAILHLLGAFGGDD
ncbi:MAG: Bax inhibitor-1/YccA family protein [Aestuariibacter sp.]